MFGGNFAPSGWALCNGQLLLIGDEPALFNLIGTTYGGDGMTTFALPDLRGRIPLHRGTGFLAGQNGGEETVIVTVAGLPSHAHTPQAQSGQGDQVSPTNGVWASSLLNQFSDSPPNTGMSAAALRTAGADQPHENMMPFLTFTFIIALDG